MIFLLFEVTVKVFLTCEFAINSAVIAKSIVIRCIGIVFHFKIVCYDGTVV